MVLEKAISIITVLSEGGDPYTGEQYPPGSPIEEISEEHGRTVGVIKSRLEG